MKKLSKICGFIMWFIIADFIVRAVQMRKLYVKYPVLNELWSGPWFAQMITPLYHAAILALFLIAVRVVLKKSGKAQFMGQIPVLLTALLRRDFI